MREETVRALLEHGIKPSRRASQQQVIDPRVLESMVDYAKLSSADVVLEIGAGIGNLTVLLARDAGRVVAVERDRRFVEILTERLKDRPNVELLFGDALRLKLPNFNKVVSNLPYAISSEIMFRLFEYKIDLAILMFQKEFADRLAARPGSDDFSRLTVNVQYRAEVRILSEVPPTAFFPQPKVCSAIVSVRPREPPFRVADEEVFFSLTRALFQHRRQRVRNALLRSFGEVFPQKHLSKAERRSFADEKLPKDLSEARVMDLAPEKFGEIANALTSP